MKSKRLPTNVLFPWIEYAWKCSCMEIPLQKVEENVFNITDRQGIADQYILLVRMANE